MNSDKSYRVNLRKLAEIAEEVAKENKELKAKIAKFNQILDEADALAVNTTDTAFLPELTANLLKITSRLRETLK